MSKPVSGRSDAALFLGRAYCTDVKANARTRTAKSHNRSTRASKKSVDLIDAIIDGERVVLATPHEREKSIEVRIRVELASAGVMVMKHHVDNRQARTGLGIGVSDLICVVPPYGRFLGIEVKRPGQEPRDEQKRWLAVVRRFGGVTGVATNVEEALALVAQARSLP
jgi:hypothetical protein